MTQGLTARAGACSTNPLLNAVKQAGNIPCAICHTTFITHCHMLMPLLNAVKQAGNNPPRCHMPYHSHCTLPYDNIPMPLLNAVKQAGNIPCAICHTTLIAHCHIPMPNTKASW